jgi:hypothetical protein
MVLENSNPLLKPVSLMIANTKRIKAAPFDKLLKTRASVKRVTTAT